MKSIKLLSLLFFVFFSAALAQRPYSPLRTYHVAEPGTLHEVFELDEMKTEFRIFYKENEGNRHAQSDWYHSSFDNIKITGRINCHDLYFLSKCDNSIKVEGAEGRFSHDFLRKIDLSEAKILGSDEPVCSVLESRYDASDQVGERYVYSREDDRIGSHVFGGGLLFLDKLILPNSLKSVHEWAFDEGAYIDTLVFGASLESFPIMNDTIVSLEDVFVDDSWEEWVAIFHADRCSNCSEYAFIEVSDKNPHFTSVHGCLYDKEVTTMLRYHPGGILKHGFPSTMTRIGRGVRVYAYELLPEMPNNLVSIGHFGISNVTGWNYEGQNPAIGKDYIYSLFLPEALESIGDYGLSFCRNTHIILGENVRYIGYKAFRNWNSYHHGPGHEILYCLSPTPPQVGNEAFFAYYDDWRDMDQVYKHKRVVVPKGSKAAYEQVPGIADYFEEIVEVEDVMAYYHEQVPVGIDEVEMHAQRPKEIGRYNLQGIRLQAPTQGINIIKYSDGTTKKVWIK